LENVQNPMPHRGPAGYEPELWSISFLHREHYGGSIAAMEVNWGRLGAERLVFTRKTLLRINSSVSL
jgi:hypothetical protein